MGRCGTRARQPPCVVALHPKLAGGGVDAALVAPATLWGNRLNLSRFILPRPKPDPLRHVLRLLQHGGVGDGDRGQGGTAYLRTTKFDSNPERSVAGL